MAEPAWSRDSVKLLFEVLFHMKVLLAQIAEFFEGGSGDGEEEEEETDEP